LIRRILVRRAIILPENISKSNASESKNIYLVFQNGLDRQVKNIMIKAVQDIKFTRLDMHIEDNGEQVLG